MGYDYYCSHCGKQLNQNTVLFDMQCLLTRDESQPFSILKFRMTIDELQKFVAAGTDAGHGYKTCRLTLAEIMAIMSNKNNLDDAAVAGLTLEHIKEYTNANLNSAANAQTADDDYDDYSDGYEEEETTATVAETSSAEKPAAILALESKSKALVDEAFIKDMLTKDLSKLQSLFLEGDVFTIEVRLENDTDNEGNPVLDGYSFRSRGIALRIRARVCTSCGIQIFEHAGTARHQSVAFIGSPKSAKSSTILALSHYAMNYMTLGFGSPIWEGCQMVNSVTTIELVDKVSQFVTDMKNFKDGISPNKTKDTDTKEAYSVTFRVSNKAQPNKNYLLTLQDLPGELFEEGGAVSFSKVHSKFPMALTCDAYVLCFDTQTVLAGDTGMGIVGSIGQVCKWADQIQNYRAMHNGVDTYVPTMVLFTKCEELERPDAVTPPLKAMNPLDRMYCLRAEKQQIAENRLYNYFFTQFGEFGHLNKAYHAMMRCSPFGYNAPRADEIEDAKKKGDELVIHPPVPKNIDQLMRWLLSITGCVPTEASYGIGGTAPFELHNFCLSRPQLRKQNPGRDDVQEHIINEAMARCALFENPGRFDREVVMHHGDGRFVLGPILVKRRMQQNTNDR